MSFQYFSNFFAPVNAAAKNFFAPVDAAAKIFFSNMWVLLILWLRFSVRGLLSQSAHTLLILIDVVRLLFEYT